MLRKRDKIVLFLLGLALLLALILAFGAQRRDSSSLSLAQSTRSDSTRMEEMIEAAEKLLGELQKNNKEIEGISKELQGAKGYFDDYLSKNDRVIYNNLLSSGALLRRDLKRLEQSLVRIKQLGKPDRIWKEHEIRLFNALIDDINTKLASSSRYLQNIKSNLDQTSKLLGDPGILSPIKSGFKSNVDDASKDIGSRLTDLKKYVDALGEEKNEDGGIILVASPPPGEIGPPPAPVERQSSAFDKYQWIMLYDSTKPKGETLINSWEQYAPEYWREYVLAVDVSRPESSPLARGTATGYDYDRAYGFIAPIDELQERPDGMLVGNERFSTHLRSNQVINEIQRIYLYQQE